MAKPIEVYFWPTPNGHKITIALEELGLDYELKPVNISAGDQFAPAFLAISPNNRMPAIIDPEGPDGRPISVFESGAILQYLGRKTGKLYPADERKRVAVDEWLMWQMANLGPMSGQAGHFILYAPRIVDDASKLEYGQQRYRNEVNRLYGVLDRRLEGRHYVADEYSIADIASWPWARSTQAGFGADIFEPFPNVKEWFQRIDARPAVQRAVAAGAELSRPLTALSKEELERTSKIIFGQTAQSIAEAAKARA